MLVDSANIIFPASFYIFLASLKVERSRQYLAKETKNSRLISAAYSLSI